jgi:hypothetical protein
MKSGTPVTTNVVRPSVTTTTTPQVNTVGNKLPDYQVGPLNPVEYPDNSKGPMPERGISSGNS